MSGVVRLREWLRARPLIADALFALVLFGMSLLPYAQNPASGHRSVELTPLLFGVQAAASACLVLRRRNPWGVWAATTAVGLVGVIATGGPTPTYVPALVALYTVSLSVGTGVAVRAALVSALLPIVCVMATGPWGTFDLMAYGMVPWSALAAMSGVAVRGQRAVLASARERAREAEATREEEAQRRVAEERLRIARELHDVVAHHVSVINVQAGVAGHLLRSDPEGAGEAIAHVREASQAVLREVPGLLGMLRTDEDQLERAPAPRLEDIGTVVEQARRSGLEVVWRTTGAPVELPASIDLATYRIVQEALTNAARHGTGQVLLTVEHAAGAVRIGVSNHQARPGSTTTTVGHHGLIGMRERALAAGGTFAAGPNESGDWVVRAELPVAPSSWAAGAAHPVGER